MSEDKFKVELPPKPWENRYAFINRLVRTFYSAKNTSKVYGTFEGMKVIMEEE